LIGQSLFFLIAAIAVRTGPSVENEHAWAKEKLRKDQGVRAHAGGSGSSGSVVARRLAENEDAGINFCRGLQSTHREAMKGLSQ
jgi:hypothetical protein